MRGATSTQPTNGSHWIISIHAPHARSDVDLLDLVIGEPISIHAPHARSDAKLRPPARRMRRFQSTLLMRGATGQLYQCLEQYQISIHAPHARSDDFLCDLCGVDGDISIHAPHARSDGTLEVGFGQHLISIHAPHARSDVKPSSLAAIDDDISIHAPHARSDCVTFKH